MATYKQKTFEPDFTDRPLPFQAREGINSRQMNRSSHPAWAAVKKAEGSPSRAISGKNGLLFSSANKENVRSWLDSTCPNSLLSPSIGNQQNVDVPPPTPSPICSPSAASTPLSSPYVSREQAQLRRHMSPPISGISQSNDNSTHPQIRFQERKLGESTSFVSRNGKDIHNELPPDSPTGSAVSSGSEGGLLALLASKLLSYKENGKRSSRYARECSGPIEEKHVVEDRSRKPPVEEIVDAPATDTHLRPQDSEAYTIGRNSSLYRTASEAVSEISLGSANGRTLSMEFDALLATAVATGIHQATTLDGQQPLQQLPEIQEDVSLAGRTGPGQRSNSDVRALARVGAERQMFSDDEAGRLMRALTVTRQGWDSEDMDFNSTLSEFQASSRSSIGHGNRRGEAEEDNNLQIVPTTIGVRDDSLSPPVNRESLLESSSCGSSGENMLAMVPATNATSDYLYMSGSSSRSSGQCEEKNMMSIVPVPASQALEKVRRDKIHAQAIAYQDAKSSKCNNRYNREESKITVWENQQKIKASLRMKKVEMRLEQKRAKALEKMQNELARARRAAEERKASAEAVRAAKTARVVEEAANIRKTGKLPSTAIVGCFPF